MLQNTYSGVSPAPRYWLCIPLALAVETQRAGRPLGGDFREPRVEGQADARHHRDTIERGRSACAATSFAHPCPRNIASAPRVAQPVILRSMAAQTRYMPMAMTLVTKRPANESGTSKREDNTSIRLPMPLLAATVSATMVPTNANVIATFSEAKKYGMDRGSPTFLITCQRLAPQARRPACNSGSPVAKPGATLPRVGKKAMRKAVMIAGMVPTPNQITKMGTTATFGMELNPIIAGSQVSDDEVVQ